MESRRENKKTPLFTVFRKETTSKKEEYLTRAIAVLIAVIISLAIVSLIVKDLPHNVILVLVEGAFYNPAVLVYYSCLLLGFGVAIVPAFKMKYWNMGANGQVLMGSLAACMVMFYGKNINNFVLILLMLITAILVSVIWAVIPSLFKVFFKTNETLFTLMMNYLSIGLVAYFNYIMAKGKKESPGTINDTTNGGNCEGWLNIDFLPEKYSCYIIPIIVIIIITVIIGIYMKKTKHGYEVTVIGDSVNTARYVGMNTKWITIRTLILSGVITGIIGFLFASCVEHAVSQTQCGAMGFTGILIAWLANFNPLIMGGISFALAFLTKGNEIVTASYCLGSNDITSVIIGLIFFAVLISEFFIRYRIKINNNGTKISEILTKIFNKKDNIVVTETVNTNVEKEKNEETSTEEVSK